METAINKAIIYDDQCPLCHWYTGEFVRFGILGQQNRVAFKDLHKHTRINEIDAERAKSEIPLVDLQGGKTLYGIDSLIYLLQTRFPSLMKVAKTQPFYWFFKRLYFLVSYNRRVITGAHKTFYVCDCTPPFSLKYRLAYIALMAVLASVFTWVYSAALVSEANMIFTSEWQLLIAIGAGWVLQGFFTFPFFKDKKQWIEYAGHLATIAVIGSAVLMPAVWLSPFLGVATLFGACMFSFPFMLYLHEKRVNSGEWQQWLTISWAFFLLAALIIGLTQNI